MKTIALVTLGLLAFTAAPAQSIAPFFPTDFVAIQAASYSGVLGPVAVVASGGTVTWENHEFLDAFGVPISAHTATADDGSFDSGTLAPHGLFSTVIDKPVGSVIPYHCALHPFMVGVIVVR